MLWFFCLKIENDQKNKNRKKTGRIFFEKNENFGKKELAATATICYLTLGKIKEKLYIFNFFWTYKKWVVYIKLGGPRGPQVLYTQLSFYIFKKSFKYKAFSFIFSIKKSKKKNANRNWNEPEPVWTGTGVQRSGFEPNRTEPWVWCNQ